MITAGVGLPGAAIIEAVSIAHGCRAQRPNQRQNDVGLGLTPSLIPELKQVPGCAAARLTRQHDRGRQRRQPS